MELYFNTYLDNYNLAPRKSEALLKLVEKLKHSDIDQELLNSILRFLLQLTSGNMVEEDPYPIDLTPLNHPKFRFENTIWT